MLSTLKMYPNLQYNPIKIQDYTVVEFYTDTISSTTRIGYYILPIAGLSARDIQLKIEDLMSYQIPEGYDKSIMLFSTDNTLNYDNFNHRICYVVYYNGEQLPSYPASPTLGTEISPSEPFNPWNEITITNNGGSTPISLILDIPEIENNTAITFYINDDSYTIVIPEPGSLKISQQIILMNNVTIQNFNLRSWPKLNAGTNIIKVPKNYVSQVKISYKLQY